MAGQRRRAFELAGLSCGLLLSGCAKHADFLEIRDQISTIAKTQDQEQKRFEAMQRRLESLERVREPEGGKLRLDDAQARLWTRCRYSAAAPGAEDGCGARSLRSTLIASS